MSRSATLKGETRLGNMYMKNFIMDGHTHIEQNQKNGHGNGNGNGRDTQQSPLSREGVGIEWERSLRVVSPRVFSIEETPQPRDLRRQVYHDDLHLYVQLQPQDLLARLERRLARRDEHVPGDAEPLQFIDHLAELGAPRKHAQLTE